MDLFFLNSIIRHGIAARFVRATNIDTGTLFTLVDENRVNHQNILRAPPRYYQLNGDNHLALSRLIHNLLSGFQVRDFPSSDLYDDMFFSPTDAGIWICVVNTNGKRKVEIRIMRGAGLQFMAIFELPPPFSGRRRSLSPVPENRHGSHRSRRGSAGNITPHPLFKSRKSTSSLLTSSKDSGQNEKNIPTFPIYTESLSNYVLLSFTQYFAFLIIYATQHQKYAE